MLGQGKVLQGVCEGRWLFGTAIAVRREWTPSASEALRLVREHIKLRRPGVRIEDERGNPVTFFQLKALAVVREPGKGSAEIRGRKPSGKPVSSPDTGAR